MKIKSVLSFLLAAFSLSALAQQNVWNDYINNEQVNISSMYTECHQPSKGLHHENVLLRITNKTNAELTVAYHLKRVYNGKEVKADVSDYTFTVPANRTLESSCDNLTEGLYVFSRILDVKAKSILNAFELENITINGQAIAK